MTGASGLSAVGSVLIDFGQGYLFDLEAGCRDGGDAFEWGNLWERKAAPVDEAGIIFLTRKQAGDTRIVVQVADVLPARADPAADHVVELGLRCESGRLRFTGWETSDAGFELAVPAGPLRVRVQWLGLARAVELEEAGDFDGVEDAESLRCDIAPGEAEGVRVVRWWREWVPPAPEASTLSGLRLLAGPAAMQHRATLEPVSLTFWSPYPQLFGGHVTSMWRDATTGVRWANGMRGGHPMLAELTADEADELASQGFFAGHTFARDERGRIWSSGEIPIERTPCLNYIAPDHYNVVRALHLSQREVPLPDGWSRVYERDLEGRLVGLVADVPDGATSNTYQRWPDNGPGPEQ
ncbi:MAG: hypothetical protein ACYDAN_07430 [Candidatus Limnocylindrales bacterium]